VVFRKQPELFDDHSSWNLLYALKVLDGEHASSRVLGSVEQDSDERMSDLDVAALIERSRWTQSLDFSDEQDYESAGDAGVGDAYAFGDSESEEAKAPPRVNKYRYQPTVRTQVRG